MLQRLQTLQIKHCMIPDTSQAPDSTLACTGEAPSKKEGGGQVTTAGTQLVSTKFSLMLGERKSCCQKLDCVGSWFAPVQGCGFLRGKAPLHTLTGDVRSGWVEGCRPGPLAPLPQRKLQVSSHFFSSLGFSLWIHTGTRTGILFLSASSLRR